MRISDWSSDVCSSDLPDLMVLARAAGLSLVLAGGGALAAAAFLRLLGGRRSAALAMLAFAVGMLALRPPYPSAVRWFEAGLRPPVHEPEDRGGKAGLVSDLPLCVGEG